MSAVPEDESGMDEPTPTDHDNPSFDTPTSDDGFDEPSDDVKRRNLITAAVIGGFVFLWVAYGLRGALF